MGFLIEFIGALYWFMILTCCLWQHFHQVLPFNLLEWSFFKETAKCFITLSYQSYKFFSFGISTVLFNKLSFIQKSDKLYVNFLVYYQFFYIVITFYLGSLVWHIMWAWEPKLNFPSLIHIFLFMYLCSMYTPGFGVLFLRILFHCVPILKYHFIASVTN